jgi:AraC family transcriptional regulator
VKPRIIEKGEMIIVGMVYYGDPFHDTAAAPEQNEIGKLWGRFNTYWEGHRDAFKHQVNDKVAWELHIGTDEYKETKEYFVMAGIEVSEIEIWVPVQAKV